jgi:hypothetical protein
MHVDFVYSAVLAFELRAFTLSHSTSLFWGWVFLRLGACELFAWAGFEPPTS